MFHDFGRELFCCTAVSFGQRMKRAWWFYLTAIAYVGFGVVALLFIPVYDEERLILIIVFFGFAVFLLGWWILYAMRKKPSEVIIYERGAMFNLDMRTQSVAFDDLRHIQPGLRATTLRTNSTVIELNKSNTPKYAKAIRALCAAYEAYLQQNDSAERADYRDRLGQLQDGKRGYRKLRRRGAVVVVIGAVIVILLFAAGEYAFQNPFMIREDRVNLHLNERGIGAVVSILTGGYEIYFSNIADIELLPYSARQLGDTIANLHIPRSGGGGTTPRYLAVQYTRGGHYRVHVSTRQGSAPTIWITRYEGVPVLLSFHDSAWTEWLHWHLRAAWREYRTASEGV